MAAVEREVIYRLKAVVDPASQGAFAQMAQMQQQSQAQRSAAAGGAATPAAATSAIQQQTQALRQQTEEINRQSSVHRTASSESMRYASQQASLANDTAANYKKAANAAMDLVRAAVLFGAANEKEMERAVRTIARVEGGLRAAHGAMELLDAGGQGAAGFLGGSKGAAAGGLAGVAGNAGPIGVAALAGTAVVIGGLAAVFPSIREGLLEFIGWTDKAGDALRAASERAGKFLSDFGNERQRQSAITATQSAISDVQLRARQLGITDPLQLAQLAEGEANSRIAAAKDELFGLTQQSGAGGAFQAQRTAATERMTAAQQDLFRAQEQIAKVQKQAQEAAIQAERQRLGMIQDQIKATTAQIEAEKQRLMSQEERLANLDPITAQQTAAAGRLANSGGQLSVEQANLLGGFTGFDAQRQAAFRRQVEASGLGFLLDAQRGVVANLEERRTQQVTVAGKLEHTIHLIAERGDDKDTLDMAKRTAEALVEQLRKQLDVKEAETRAILATQAVQRGGR